MEDAARPSKRSVLISVTAVAIAAVVLIVVLTPRYDTGASAATWFFAAAGAACWLGYQFSESGSALLAGGLAAGWTSSVVYASVGGFGAGGWGALVIEMMCVSGATPGLALARRGLRRTETGDSAATVLLAALLIPFWCVAAFRVLPLLLRVAAVSGSLQLARRPVSGVMLAGCVAVFFWAGDPARLVLLIGLGVGIVAVLASRALRAPLERLDHRGR
ncbi:hypothetical protein EDD99_6286 [Streptomyces sp. 846.5]|nr:hypothetical protein [Streptomyces sp. 846.5]TDT98073.1 hypothetical protein EDD99_6286 [Streptomyces sp. 846.5]